jgi:hypothetical protein
MHFRNPSSRFGTSFTIIALRSKCPPELFAAQMDISRGIWTQPHPRLSAAFRPRFVLARWVAFPETTQPAFDRRERSSPSAESTARCGVSQLPSIVLQPQKPDDEALSCSSIRLVSRDGVGGRLYLEFMNVNREPSKFFSKCVSTLQGPPRRRDGSAPWSGIRFNGSSFFSKSRVYIVK